jgi:hypothetical protein
LRPFLTHSKIEKILSILLGLCQTAKLLNRIITFCFTYVEQEDTREKIDIVALNAEIEKIVAREQVLGKK